MTISRCGYFGIRYGLVTLKTVLNYAIYTTQKDLAESGQTQSTNMLDVYDLKRFSCASLGGRDGIVTLNYQIISVYSRCLCFRKIEDLGVALWVVEMI